MNLQGLISFSDNFIKLLISVSDLNEEQEEEVYNLLETQVKMFVKSRDYSSNKRKGVRALTDFINKAYEVSLMAVNMGSLEIIVECPTLRSLEHLWKDYLSGYLDKVAERYLVTDEMKKKVGLETINLKTTIDEENYLACSKFLTKMPGACSCKCLIMTKRTKECDFGYAWEVPCTREANRALVKEQDTSWVMRMEKAKVSRSALHRASINGQYEDVNKHLKNGANVDERDQFLLTPLHLACWYGHESVVKLLLDHNADVNALDRFQFTPLQKAEHCNHQSIIQLLLDHDAKPSFQQPLSLRTLAKRAFLRTDSHSGFNVLQAVVLQGDFDSVYKASTLLENFVEQMKCETISNNASIFRGKAAVDILSSAMAWRKPGHTDIELLYRRLVGIDETLNELHSCAKSGDVEKVIELVLNDGIDVNVAAKSNITPLLLASGMSSGVLIKTLIDLGADVNAQTAPAKEGPLVFAASSNNYMVARVLLEHSADANIKDLWGVTPLYKAVMQKNVPLVDLLLENKADVNIQDWVRETPLHKAVMWKDVPLIKILLENKADANIKDHCGETPFQKAFTQKDVPLIKLLLENKADANIPDWQGETPLHKAVTQTNVPLVEQLLENTADANIQNGAGETPLHKAVAQRNEPLIKLLLENKADANIQDRKGETPLHKAVTQENIPLIKLLLENKSDANIQDCKGQTPLHKAVAQRNGPLIKLLLENKADANIVDLRGETPLHKAVRRRISEPLVKLFLENKADANIRDQEGETPLHLAVTLEDLPLVKLLLEGKADVNIRDKKGETPLHKAVTRTSEPLVKQLLENKADANIRDKKGETPLHKAVRCRWRSEPFVKLLLENKADANIRDQEGETPLHEAVTLEDLPVVKLLIENKADANIQNQWGNTPLHKCAHYGFSDTSQMLIESGCNINLRNKKGETFSDIETSRRQWSKRPSARYSQDFESSTPQWRFHRGWLDLTKIEPESEDVTEAEDIHLKLPQVARLPYGSEQSLEEVVSEADEKWLSKGVLMKKQQELSSLEEETQARLTRQSEMTKEVKEKGQAS
ncbi:ankyrin-1-like [Montipora capricornis]|uniref:ankyrin-1-like n=1 Tax=Montipora capricornis TaxID=246305 RepID=UPI0035F12BBF